jgi:hypothetical protein
MSEITAALALPQLQHLDHLVERLQPLQRRVATLLRKLPGVQAVLPDTQRAATTNGTHAGAWYATAERAEHDARLLIAAGVRCWHPYDGDLHTAEAWPVRLPSKRSRPQPDLRRYLDIQIPCLQSANHDLFCDLIAQAVGERP